MSTAHTVIFYPSSVCVTVADKIMSWFFLFSSIFYSNGSRKSNWINKTTHLWGKRWGFFCNRNLTINQHHAIKACSLLHRAVTVISEMWSFMCRYREICKLENLRLNFKKARTIYLGIFKLASTYWLNQQTSGRILHPKENCHFYHFQLFLELLL